MKFASFLSLLLLATAVTYTAFAQSEDVKVTSTVENSNTEADLKAEEEINEERKENADALRKEYRDKAKDAKRIEKDAAYASKQARLSSKRERQAQKARKSAEKQTKKAQKAAEKSDRN